MGRNRVRQLGLKIAMALLIFNGMSSLFLMSADAATEKTAEEYMDIIGTYSISDEIPSYIEYRAMHEEKDSDDSIIVNADEYVRYENAGEAAEPELFLDYEGMSGNSILIGEEGLVEYEVEVKEEGYYHLSLNYYPVEGKNSSIERALFVDGELPYGELSTLEFSRIWVNEVTDSSLDANGVKVKNWKYDNQGNQMKPTMKEQPEWTEGYLYDSEGYITQELAIYFTKGVHTLSMLSIREPMLLRSITFGTIGSTAGYEEVLKLQKEQGAVDTSSQVIRIEAENVDRTSSQMLYPKQDQSSPSVYPSSTKYLLNNSIGGNSWKTTGQWMEWDFEAEETGFYNIMLHDRQSFMRGIYISRKITLDGEVPFQEMSDYGFAYDQNWREDVLSDDSGNAYRFYLEKGHHTLRMEVVLGDFSQIISEVQDSVQKLNAIYRKVICITGVAPDIYRDYQITASLPGLEAELTEVRDQLDHAISSLRQVAGKGSDKETVLITMRDQLDELIYDQERFAEVISSYKINVRATGNWITQVLSQPLQLDAIYIYSPDEKVNVKGDGFMAKAGFELERLFYSFVIDYNQIGNVEQDDESRTITLWIGTGRDQANVIKSLIDESFTSKTGINVNVQLVDMSTLLRAELAGEGPDVAIQVANTTGIAGAVLNTGNDTPVNYGLRNAVLDLTQFSDFDEVCKRFDDSAMVGFTFDGATYALPETQTFPMMFYRKDILAEIGLEVPRTWDEVKVAMTVLSKNQMEFGMLPSEQIYAMILYQLGGRYYNDDGSKSELDSDIAVNAFKDYCEYYTDYKLDKETSVEERFRTGECPIIIADYTVYNNLQVSAPDIAGMWDFTVVPGIETEDGSINHATGCTGLASIIMSDTDDPDGCWEFLKWWTSADTQTMYGVEMEGLMGTSARVATANLEALGNLSWPIRDYKELTAQLEQVQGIPQVPGGYYSWRNVNNAFYTVTTETDTASPREQLMDKVIYINDEITYKRREFELPVNED